MRDREVVADDEEAAVRVEGRSWVVARGPALWVCEVERGPRPVWRGGGVEETVALQQQLAGQSFEKTERQLLRLQG